MTPLLHTLLEIILGMIVAGGGWWLIGYVGGIMTLPAKLVQIIQVIWIVICLIAVVEYAGLLGHF